MNVQKTNNVSFTSVMPMKVFIDGVQSGNEDNIRRATRLLANTLKGPAKDKPEYVKLIQKFAQHDRDYSYETGMLGYDGATSKFFRNVINKTQAYFFTGPQAQALEKLGKRIGPAKGNGNKRFNDTATFEAKTFAKVYFAKASDFIENQKIRVKEFLNKKTRKYEGENVTLNVYTKSSGQYGKKGFKLSLQDIEFKKD